MLDKKLDPTTINEYFYWLEQSIRPDTALYKAAHAYLEGQRMASEAPKEGDAPFLSIVTRTQGKRPEMLTEVLLCLTAQSNTDFELLVMGHNLDAEQHRTVAQIIDELPDWMREKTRLIPVCGGTRTTPLNAGFEAAKGEYIVVLDDDDLVFDNWVEAFYDLSKENKGKILHTYTVIQDWETVGGDYPNTPRAADSPKNTYCRDFNFMDELKVNYCPLCALAFPAYAFRKWGIRFDETLTTTEDWDYLMRCSFLTGVANSPEITFLYRNWLNTENSSTLHNHDEWKNNYRKIVERFVNTPMILPTGTLKDVVNCENGTVALEQKKELQLFYDDGNGFCAEKQWSQDLSYNDGTYSICFHAQEDGSVTVQALRFDPQDFGYLTVEGLYMRVILADDSSLDYTIRDVETNGYRLGEKLVFLKNDPQVLIRFDTPVLAKQILIDCTLTKNVTDEDVTAAIAAHRRGKRSLVRRIYRRLIH